VYAKTGPFTNAFAAAQSTKKAAEAALSKRREPEDQSE
jgi:hypothetical protein